MSKIKIEFKPHELQQKIFNAYLDDKNKFIISKLGRRSGKTFLSCYILIYHSIKNKGSKNLFLSPTFRLATEVFNIVLSKVINTPLLLRFNKSEYIIEFFNGSTIEFFSSNNSDSIRGKTFNGVGILDEAAFLSDYSINEVVLPCFATAINPKILFFSTPLMERGTFYEYYKKGLTGCKNFISFSGPSSISPYVNESYLELMKSTLSDKAYRREILAEFSKIGQDSLFKNIIQCICVGDKTDKLYSGLDIGHKDSTVLTILNSEGKMYKQFVWTEIDFNIVIEEIANILNDLKVAVCYIEQNGIGLPVLHLLQCKAKCVQPWVTSNKSKNDIIEALMLAFEKSEIGILDIQELIHQLNIYETQSTAGGSITFNAPNGEHDDMVMSLAIAYRCFEDEIKNKFYNVY